MDKIHLALEVAGVLAVTCGLLAHLPFPAKAKALFVRAGFYLGSFAKLEPPKDDTAAAKDPAS